MREFTMPSDEEKESPQEANGPQAIAVTPIEWLGIILKTVLKERITDEEVEAICSVYWQTVKEWWGGDEPPGCAVRLGLTGPQLPVFCRGYAPVWRRSRR